MSIATAPAEITAPILVDEIDTPETMIEESILAFLNGESDGEDLFNALYGDVLDEPIPAAMLELVRGEPVKG